MEFTEDRCDVFSGAGTSEEACSWVLDILKFFEDFVGGAVEKTIAVVKPGWNESVDECRSSGSWQVGAEAGDVSEVEKGSFGNMVNMGEEGESGVQDNSKVTDFGGGGDGGAVNVKGEVQSGLSEGVMLLALPLLMLLVLPTRT